MKQINYFKFLEKFPEFIDMNDSNEVKLSILKYLKKIYWRKKDDEIPHFLSLTNKNMVQDIKYYEDKGFVNFNYNITFRGLRLYSLHFIKNGPPQITYPIIYLQSRINNKMIDFLSVEEVTNLKRTLLIDNMLK